LVYQYVNVFLLVNGKLAHNAGVIYRIKLASADWY
jgi:hypothetical protein